MLFSILLIILGLLAIPSLVISKKPEAKEMFDKIAPFQGWIGIVFAIFGIWGIISCLIHVGVISIAPILWITSLVVSVVEACLGFILGYNLINQYVLAKNPEAAEKGKEMLTRLLPLQGQLGILAILLGIWGIIASIIWTVA